MNLNLNNSQKFDMFGIMNPFKYGIYAQDAITVNGPYPFPLLLPEDEAKERKAYLLIGLRKALCDREVDEYLVGRYDWDSDEERERAYEEALQKEHKREEDHKAFYASDDGEIAVCFANMYANGGPAGELVNTFYQKGLPWIADKRNRSAMRVQFEKLGVEVPDCLQYP